MRILTFDELPEGSEAERSLIHLAAFGGVFSRAQIGVYRRAGSLAEYVGVFAVERGHLLGQVFVARIPYAFRDGPGTLAGIVAVGTRPDRARSGIARALLLDAHRREREAGQSHSALWTNRSWGAHGLYDRLGYRDVYSSPWIVRRAGIDPIRRSRAPGLRPGRRSDLSSIDRLHDRLAADRLGYYRRSDGFSIAEARVGALDPAKNLIILSRDGRMRGYAHFDRGPGRVICGELVADSFSARRELVRELVRRAKAVPLAFQNTPVTDAPKLFGGPEYARLSRAWYGMMGCALDRSWTTHEAVRHFGCDDPAFICLTGDRF